VSGCDCDCGCGYDCVWVGAGGARGGVTRLTAWLLESLSAALCLLCVGVKLYLYGRETKTKANVWFSCPF
jgi:hypothetical protein